MLKKRLMAKKSIAQIQNEANHCEFKRTLGKWNLLSLGIGCIIGAGIFSLTGAAAANHAGPAIMLSFICAGFACAFAGSVCLDNGLVAGAGIWACRLHRGGELVGLFG
jgi:amino acid permease